MRKEQINQASPRTLGKARRSLLAKCGAGVCVAVTVLAAGGCGSSSKGHTATGTVASSHGTGPESAQLAPFLKAPTSIPDTLPLTKSPRGKTVAYLECSVVNCQQHAIELKQAFSALGVHLMTINSGLSPETFSNAFAQAEQEKPDGVIYDAIPASIAQPQVNKLAAEHIPVVALVSPDLKLGKDVYNIDGSKFFMANGSAMANWIINDSKGRANVLFLRDTTLAFGTPETNAIMATFKKNCPSCQVASLQTSSAEASQLPAEVSGYIQKHPTVNYVLAQYSALMIGLPSQLRAAGQTGVKLVGLGPTQINDQYLKAGEEAAEMMHSDDALSWQAANTMARALAGDPVSRQETADPAGTTQLLTPTQVNWNVSQIWPWIPDFKKQYLKLWAGAS
jgi:ribose transport system substrate-binding protein